MISIQDLETCLSVLSALQDADPKSEAYLRVERAAAHLRKTAKKKRSRARRAETARHDRAIIETAELHRQKSVPPSANQTTPSTAPSVEPAGELRRHRHCFVCKSPYRTVDGFYHALCPDCAEVNRSKRELCADLRGRRAIVTGGRVKIGYAAALRLLRCGAAVTVTTRFPRDAARRYGGEADFESWAPRLRIVGLDFRVPAETLNWIEAEIETSTALDILINNAAQTVWRPPEWTRDVEALERRRLPPQQERLIETPLPVGDANLVPSPTQLLDYEGAALDLRTTNSWRETLDQVDPIEALEAVLINQFAPMLFTGRLRKLLRQSRFKDRYVVNVSAMEGKFDYRGKTPRHPHTNMAKAALNMMTRTCAADYAKDGIYMTSVDTGWVSQENPAPLRENIEAAGFHPPYDVIDGASRVLDPVLAGVRGGEKSFGVLLRDFIPATW